MTRTRTLAATTALLALGAFATACGGDDPAPAAATSPTPEALAANGAGALDGAASATPVSRGGLLDCLVPHDGVIVRTERSYDAESAVGVPRLSVLLDDREEDFEPAGGWLRVYPDAAAAQAGAEAALAEDRAHGDVDDLGSASVHGNVVWVQKFPLAAPPTADEQAVLGCLPGAAVAPPAPPRGSPGAVLECAEAAGFETEYEKYWYDVPERGWGWLRVDPLDGYGGAQTYFFADAKAARKQRRELVGDPALAIVDRTRITLFLSTIRPDRPRTKAFLACLDSPAAPTVPSRATANVFDDDLVVTEGVSSGLLAGCLIDRGLVADGPIASELLDGTVPSDEISWKTSDSGDPEENSGMLYVFADSASATAHAQAAYDQELGGSIGTLSTFSQHQNVVLMLNEPVDGAGTPEEQALLSCLPGADPAVTEPEPGLHTVGSVIACLETAGIQASADHDGWDDYDGKLGRVETRYFDGQQAYVTVYADAADAGAAGAAYVSGNATVEWSYEPDPTSAPTAAVQACLPADA